MIQEIVQNVLVYVVMTTILRGLISDKGFLEVFRFVSGLILILLFISPVLSVFSLDAEWYRKLEENIFQVDKKQVEQQMRVADGSFEKVLLQECEKQVEQQIRDFSEENGQISQEVDVSLNVKEDGTWSVGQIQMTIGQEVQETLSRGKDQSDQDGKQENIEKIQKIVIDTGQNQTTEREGQNFQEDGETRRLKKKICKKYQLSEKVVDVWKINGENY